MKSNSIWRNNGLSITLAVIFLALVCGQILTGWHDNNNEQLLHREAALSLGEYLQSGAFFEALFENWESEFLQMGAYIVLTKFLFQRGSSESKDPDKPDESEEQCPVSDDSPPVVKQGGWKLTLYKHSLSIAFFTCFAFAFIGHLIGGAADYSDELKQFGHAGVTPLQYLVSARFWFESLQNWQSEFLAVLAIVVLSIWLREEGSPESKPLAAPHSQTGD